MEVVIRDTEAAAAAAFDEIQEIHQIHGRIGSDGSARSLGVGGPPELVANFMGRYAEVGIEEVLWIFRNPFDLETISRLHEVRALVG